MLAALTSALQVTQMSFSCLSDCHAPDLMLIVWFSCVCMCFSGDVLHTDTMRQGSWSDSVHLIESCQNILIPNTFWPQWVDDEGNTDAIICCMLYRSKQCINKTLAFTDTQLYSNAMACVAASCVSAIWMSPDAALFSFYLFFLNQETEMLSVRRETCTNPGVYLFITSSYRPPFRAYRFLTK